jgi:hypothetical protein
MPVALDRSSAGSGWQVREYFGEDTEENVLLKRELPNPLDYTSTLASKAKTTTSSGASFDLH